MDNNKGSTYNPEYAVPPGDTLQEILESIGMTQTDLALRCGRPIKTINEIIKGNTKITPATSIQFERVLGIPASFWNNLERQYRETLASIEEEESLRRNLDWLKNMPVNEMSKAGWIRRTDDKCSQLREVLSFFGVANTDQWNEKWQGSRAQFRQSKAFQINQWSVAAWLRQGERIAQKITCAEYSSKTFKDALKQIRKLTYEPLDVFLPQLIEKCANSGIALVFVPELPGTRVFGATYWLTTEKALIQLSLRYKSDDLLWFTFFHEAAHLVKHGRRDVFLECEGLFNEKENDADKFAANMLIPPYELKMFKKQHRRICKEAIKKFAARIQIAPGIIVGRLQHDGLLSQKQCNGLKRRFRWEDIKFNQPSSNLLS